MKVSPNFNREEFACQCGCGFDSVDIQLLTVLEETREYFKELYPDQNIYITITSGNRCPEHNIAIGSTATQSKHTKGIAVDFKVNSVSSDEVHQYLCNKYPNCFGIGKYVGRTHLDVRSTKARW